MAIKQKLPTEKPLFSFGVITDTHIRAPQGDLSSPFPVNEHANDRARYAAGLLAAQQVKFTIHLGDMVHPLPGMPAYDSACKEALDIFQPLQPNLYFAPGNHDIGDKPMPGLPAAAINNAALKDYQKHFSNDYHSFVEGELLFVVLNSSLINCQNEQAEKQVNWLEDLLQENHQRRIVLISHYPLFINSEQEPEHYDNLAEPGRSWLIGLVKKYKIELVLSGHVHHFFYNRLDHATLYTLPPTSFTRQDYAELFRVSAAAEHGRDDKEKYSVAVIDIYKTHHELRVIPTNGEFSEANSKPGYSAVTAVSKKNITLHLRHAWYESIDLPYNGPMEEFSRKRARNDYLFMRFQQMGIKDLRIPLQELSDPQILKRIQDYKALDFKFHGFCPQHQLSKLLTDCGEHLPLLSTIEIVTSGTTELPDSNELVRQTAGVPLIVGHALSGAHNSDASKPFAHSVSSGFNWTDHDTLIPIFRDHYKEGSLHAMVFQIRWEESVEQTLSQMQSAFESLPFKCIANVRLANTNPAVANFNDDEILHRIQSLVTVAKSLNGVELQLDTAMDIDRGYSPRHGLVDRRGNLRPAGKWLSQL